MGRSLKNCGTIHYSVLDLSFNRLTKIENLEALVNLQKLFLIHNKLTKIENIAHLTGLEMLELGSNRIRVRYKITDPKLWWISFLLLCLYPVIWPVCVIFKLHVCTFIVLLYNAIEYVHVYVNRCFIKYNSFSFSQFPDKSFILIRNRIWVSFPGFVLSKI